MDLRKELERFIPYNLEEEEDKKNILESMNKFSNLLSRDNKLAHFTSSVFVVNPKRDKVLMVHHNIYDNWSFIGGHCDGEEDSKKVAIKELKEETSIENFQFVDENIFAVDILPVKAHLKKGKPVSTHLHFSITYLIEVGENEKFKVKQDENSAINWIAAKDLLEFTKKEPHMNVLYEKIMKKANII